jgi:hypothetical protein
MRGRLATVAASVALCALGALAPSAQAFGIASFEGSLTGSGGQPLLQAGAHPDLTTTINLSTIPLEGGRSEVDGNVKDVKVTVPPGFVGNPTVAATCSQADLLGEGYAASCPVDSQIGIVELALEGYPARYPQPLFNMVPPPGVAAQFAFNFTSVRAFIDFRVVPSAGAPGGYALESDSLHVSQGLAINTIALTVWGVPADASHDPQRYGIGGFEIGVASPALRLPFLDNPTSCSGAPSTFGLESDSWQEPGLFHQASFDHDPSGNALTFEGCESVPFEASIQAQPTSHEADSPTGLGVTVTVPQNQNPDGLASADLKDVSVTLPEGMTINPASAGGLASCSNAQIGLGGDGAAACPDESKIGSVEVVTPLLSHPLKGGVYLARQGENKFGSLLAVYLALEDPLSGTVVKLPGRVATSAGGRLTASFEDTPQLPFESFQVNFFGGPRAPLRTPASCGTYVTAAQFTPWSGTAAVASSDSFRITSGPGGSACPAGGFDPKLEAATASPLAGGFTPFVLRLSRADGTQGLDAITATLPEGLLGSLKGIPYCPEAALAAVPRAEGTGAAELAAPACPAASQVGTVSVGAGAGSSPFYVNTGRAYLAGPYKGAPLSLAILAPALAGPLDLGNLVVRAALRVNPETTQITAVSDPLPTILSGIPLDLRSVAVSIDRADFLRNPTSCGTERVTSTIAGTAGASASPSAGFLVTDCGGLGFAPKLALRLSGKTRRAQDPALKAVLTAPPGANVKRVQVVLPESEFIDNAHIGDVCTRPQFAAEQCPANSLLGTAAARTPLLDEPLRGKVYLRSNGGERELPDLVVRLKGQIDVTLVGYIDSVRRKGSEISRLRTTFAKVPDAPVSKFVLDLAGGDRGLLENSANLCRAKQTATVKMTAHNGRRRDFRAPIATSCGAKK